MIGIGNSFQASWVLKFVHAVAFNNSHSEFYYQLNQAFKNINQNFPERLEKIKVIPGDISEQNLGMSASDRSELKSSVQVVIHSAALVKFNLRLMEIMKINVKGTQRVLQLAEEMPLLETFVYVSTAFSQSYQQYLQEKHYTTGINLLDLLQVFDMKNIEAVETIQKK